jgi:adenine-specific DNA methylase
LIEDWLPAAAIGVECIRERGSASALAPHTYLHVWWARRPLTASRAAVLGSLLPADFPRDVFERLLGFGRAGSELVEVRRLMDTGVRVPGGFGAGRAFGRSLRAEDLERASEATESLWGHAPRVIDPMAGGGSIPLESVRLGFETRANEYSPVACSILEATVDYPIRYGPELATRARAWGREWLARSERRLASFFPRRTDGLVHAYIFARTVPCPDTGFPTPLVPDWHLLKPDTGLRVVAVPRIDRKRGTWAVDIRGIGRDLGQVSEEPPPTYGDGKGVSLYTGRQIPSDYIKAKAQAGEMGSALYAVAVKTPTGLKFEPPVPVDLDAIAAAERELQKHRTAWERNNVIPTERYPEISSDPRPLTYGMPRWADMFAPRQLLAMGVLVEELRNLRPSIVDAEGSERGGAIEHLLAFGLDKFLNHNCTQTRFENTRAVVKGKMDRHDYAFKTTYAELAPCSSGSGLAWAIENVLEAWQKLAELPRSAESKPATFNLGTATRLPQLASGSVNAAVVDPPYDDNVQYSELADFFYVWLKRTQGYRHPDWFATNLSERDEEAVVNVSRFRGPGDSAAAAKDRARDHYRALMTDSFKECHRILRDDGVLTVMFTHKKQEAWEALFAALIKAGFTITATWPIKTESEHSLHQAKKNAAQSTVVLVTRKRYPNAGVGFFDRAMRTAISDRARRSAERLRDEGLNPVDQLVGSFGPALEVFSRYDEIRTDTGASVGVDLAIDEASDAVSRWRIEQLASQGLAGVEAEGRFALLCWDVLGATEFRFNEARLLGHAVGMDVETLIAAGLVAKEGDKVRILSARQRRRDRPLEADEQVETLFGPEIRARRRRRSETLKVHPNDPVYRTALDACHALALRYVEADGGAAGIGAARALTRQQDWKPGGPVAKLMAALVQAAPEAVRFDKGARSAAAQFPEFRAWHALLEPLFGVAAPEWTEKVAPQLRLPDPTTGEADYEGSTDEVESQLEEEESEED